MVVHSLSAEETKEIRERLEERLLLTMEEWHPYWYPLYPIKTNIPVIAFDSDYIARDENITKIREIFLRHNILVAIELPELDNARSIEGFLDKEYFLEKDEDGVILPYMSEHFWFDSNNDWMIYVSHEATIAFEGEWLVNAIKKEFEDYSKYEMKNFIAIHKRNYD
jgi:hypothetical protein